jgi:hypothetical protein
MAGLIRGPKPRGPSAEEQAARARAEERAESEETTAMQAAMGRRRLRRTGGMRLLFSPIRQMMQTKLGGGE